MATATKDAVAAVPSKDPVNPAVALTLPVTANEPEIMADPVYGNELPPPPPFNAKEAVNA